MQQIKCSIPNQEPIEWVLAEETGPTGGGRLADSVEEEEETEGSEHTDKVKFFSAHYDSVLLNI